MKTHLLSAFAVLVATTAFAQVVSETRNLPAVTNPAGTDVMQIEVNTGAGAMPWKYRKITLSNLVTRVSTDLRALIGVRVFDDDDARLAATPDFIGQMAVERGQHGLYYGSSTTVGGFDSKSWVFGQVDARGGLSSGYYDFGTSTLTPGFIFFQNRTDAAQTKLLGATSDDHEINLPDIGNHSSPATLLAKEHFLRATATLDFPSIAANGGTQDLTITVTGAALGQVVHFGLPASPNAGVVFNAFVSAVDTVKIRATNTTAGAIDPASASYKVSVENF